MTRQQRDHLRRAVDAARRAQIQRAARSDASLCSGCGADKTDYTPGCGACYGRRRRQREQVPCANNCGRMVDPRKFTKTGFRWTGLCRACYIEKKRAA